jgi:uncharacterized repeat protein (TIGR02059 family)
MLADNPSHRVDTIAPVLAGAAVNGASLVLTYTDATLLDAAHPPAANAFAAMLGGVTVTPNSVSIDAAAKTVTLALPQAAAPGQSVTVSYSDPAAGNDANAIQDAAGNDAASFAGQPVNNPSAPPEPPEPPTPPVEPAPTVLITLSDLALTAGETANVTFQFSAPPTGFEGSDITVENGTLSDLRVDPNNPSRYAALFTPNAGVNDDTNHISVGTGWSAGGRAPAGTAISANYTLSTDLPKPDITPPAAPALDLPASDDTGLSDSDDVTSKTIISLVGTAEPDSTLKLFKPDGALLAITRADAQGHWSVTGIDLKQIDGDDKNGVAGENGVYAFTAKAVDTAGNESIPASLAITLILDTPPPSKPLAIDLSNTSDLAGDNDPDNHITVDPAPSFDISLPSGPGIDLLPGDRLKLYAVPKAGGLEQFVGEQILTQAQIQAGAAAIEISSALPGGIYEFKLALLDPAGNIRDNAQIDAEILTDSDGVSSDTEQAYSDSSAPVSVAGDFNQDGVLDSLQSNVATFPVRSYADFALGAAAPFASFGSFMAGAPILAGGQGPVHLFDTARLSDIAVLSPDDPALNGLALPDSAAVVDRLQFTLSGKEGEALQDLDGNPSNGLQTRVVLELPQGGMNINDYYTLIPATDGAPASAIKFMADGNPDTYDDGAELLDLNGDGTIDRILITLTDNGPGDLDSRIGIIKDAGLLALNAPCPPPKIQVGNAESDMRRVNDTLIGDDESNDFLYGLRGKDLLQGLAGDDRLGGGFGRDSLQGGAGDDWLDGGKGEDSLEGGLGSDVMIGGKGRDIYVYAASQLGQDDMAAGSRDEIMDNKGLLDFSAGVESQLKIGGLALDALKKRTLVGDHFDAQNSVAFQAGELRFDLNQDGVYDPAQDFAIALSAEGVDKVYYKAGKDLFKFLGTIKINPGTAEDLAPADACMQGQYWVGDLEGDTLSIAQRFDLHTGSAFADMLYGVARPDTLNGGEGDDKLAGGLGRDILADREGNDLLFGGKRKDSLSGDAGDDQLDGGQGPDILIGGAGHDIMAGGKGRDTYVYQALALNQSDLAAGGYDTITDALRNRIDFTPEVEAALKLGGKALSELKKATPIGATIDANNSMAWTDGQLRLDLNGDGAFQPETDFYIELTGVSQVVYKAGGDFLAAF